MSRTAEARAYFKHFWQKDVNSNIRESFNDLLLIMQSEHKQLSTKMDAHKSSIDARIDALQQKIETRVEALDSRIDGLEKRMDGLEKRMDGFEVRMDRMENRMEEQTYQIVSMKKWAIGLFLAVLLAITALAAPIYITMFSIV